MSKNSKELIVKDNALINASYYLDLVEQRLILLAIIEARANKNDTDNSKDFVVCAQSYVEHFEVTNNTAYEALRNATKTLFERRFTYQRYSNKGVLETVVSRWVQNIAYAENEAYVSIRFSDDVMPLITQLEKHFTSYQLEQVKDLSSIYAIRLYEMLVQWRATGQTQQIPIDELRYKLGIEPSQYQKMVNFKSRVLDVAIKQINDHTDITAKYDQIKKGRAISAFTFNFKQKPKVKTDEINRDKNTGDMFATGGLSEAQLNKIAWNRQFELDYNHLISSTNSANQDKKEWVKEMVKLMKSKPELFKNLEKYLK